MKHISIEYMLVAGTICNSKDNVINISKPVPAGSFHSGPRIRATENSEAVQREEKT